MDKVITTLHFNRPQYTQRVLEALSRCRGIEDYTLVALTHKPFDMEVLDSLFEVDFCKTEVILAGGIGGPVGIENIAAATRRLLTRGFELADYVIHLEDDVVLAEDALEYFEWARGEYRNDMTAFTVAAFHRVMQHQPISTVDHHRTMKVPWFTPWGWATWRDRWEFINGFWPDEITTNWDVWTNKWLRAGRFEIAPYLSRSQNIGEVGTNVPSPEWHTLFQSTPVWAGNTPPGPGHFWMDERE